MSTRYTKTIVCLANSRKPPSGRCIAGREVLGASFGDWIRPVSDRPTEEIALEERRYENGQEPRLLDILSITLKAHRPHRHQKENHVIDADWYWTKRGVLSWQDLLGAVENPTGPLWLNGHSSLYGRNDRVPETVLDGLGRSLYLIRPEDLQLVVTLEGMGVAPPRRRVRAAFRFGGYSYRVALTDPLLESRLLAGPNQSIAVPEALVCLSLGEVFNGWAYKLAASVITP